MASIRTLRALIDGGGSPYPATAGFTLHRYPVLRQT